MLLKKIIENLEVGSVVSILVNYNSVVIILFDCKKFHKRRFQSEFSSLATLLFFGVDLS